MSEEKRYATDPCHSRFLTWVNVKHGGAELGDVVVAQDFDAEHALRLEAEKVQEMWFEQNGELRKANRAMKKKFSDDEWQVKELREQLGDSNCANALGDQVIIRLQAKLDKAMGLLSTGSIMLRSSQYKVSGGAAWLYGVDNFLNTTSTEGKDHG